MEGEKKVEVASIGPAQPVSRERKSSMEGNARHGDTIASHAKKGAWRYICVCLLRPSLAEVRGR